ncbi:unnamed protein product [Urochloa decumbens]|uniref:Protein kinase domain-containing protein n=1 Tax=Urochloa decumbens TaxID=240449 RepID=A0ABC8WBT3_9POAL
MSRLSMDILLCLVLLVLTACQLCAARNDPGRAPAPAGAHLPQCKLCLVVALPVAATAVAAAAVTLVVICLLRRRKMNAAAAVAVHNSGRYSHSSPPAGDVVDKGYHKPAAGSAGGDSSWRVMYDNPMSINPTMVRSPGQFYWLSHGSSPSHSQPSSTNNNNNNRSPARSGGSPSPLRRPGLPVPAPGPGRAAKREKEVKGDPLAMYSPSISVLLKEFDYEQLQGATNNFGRKSLLGRRGGPWVVFKGTKFVKDEGLPATVAIKRFRTAFTDEQCKRIRGELKFKFTLRHKNLVNLLGYSLGKGRFHLVYDYMTNGSLEQHLFPEANNNRSGSSLSWSLRHSIVLDVAQGLYQLHVTNTAHGSIRASSVMLDHDSTAHLDDHFGYRPDRGEATQQQLRAASDAALQEDIADLGALVLELVSGRRHSAAVMAGNNNATATPFDTWVRTLHGDGCLLRAVDAALEDEFNQAQASKLLLLGLDCRHPDPKLRPRIHNVRMLLLDMKPMPPPEVRSS